MWFVTVFCLLLLIFDPSLCGDTITQQETNPSCNIYEYINDLRGFHYGVLIVNTFTKSYGITIDITLKEDNDILSVNFGDVQKLDEGYYRISNWTYVMPDDHKPLQIATLVAHNPLDPRTSVASVAINGVDVCLTSREIPTSSLLSSTIKFKTHLTDEELDDNDIFKLYNGATTKSRSKRQAGFPYIPQQPSGGSPRIRRAKHHHHHHHNHNNRDDSEPGRRNQSQSRRQPEKEEEKGKIPEQPVVSDYITGILGSFLNGYQGNNGNQNPGYPQNGNNQGSGNLGFPQGGNGFGIQDYLQNLGFGNLGIGNQGLGNQGYPQSNGFGNHGNGFGNQDVGFGNQGNQGLGNQGMGNQGLGNQGMGNQGLGNQGQANQGLGNQGFGNQGLGNQGFGNQGLGNQGLGNQGLGNQVSGNQGLGNQGLGNQGLGNQGLGNQGSGNQGLGNQGSGNQGLGNQGSGNQGLGNQGSGNQGLGNQGLANQNLGNQGFGNQGLGNQGLGNQGYPQGNQQNLYPQNEGLNNQYPNNQNNQNQFQNQGSTPNLQNGQNTNQRPANQFSGGTNRPNLEIQGNQGNRGNQGQLKDGVGTGGQFVDQQYGNPYQYNSNYPNNYFHNNPNIIDNKQPPISQSNRGTSRRNKVKPNRGQSVYPQDGGYFTNPNIGFMSTRRNDEELRSEILKVFGTPGPNDLGSKVGETEEHGEDKVDDNLLQSVFGETES